MKCKNCGAKSLEERLLDFYDASALLGAPFTVTLGNCVWAQHCSECDELLGHTLVKPIELIAMVATLRASDSIKLNGQEIRFLRKSLSLKAKDLADRLSITAPQLSRFENNKVPISEMCERLLRALVCLYHFERVVEANVPSINFTHLSRDFVQMKIDPVRVAGRNPSYHLELEAPKQEDDSGNMQVVGVC